MAERIGILGGTFQPIHNGHILLAEHAKNVLSLDRVLFVIDRIPPHKEINSGASTDDRLNMLRLALTGHAGLEVETMELFREGKSYSFDTLTELKQKLPRAQLYFLMGSDMLRSFSTWYKPEGICKLCTLVCTERTGQNGGEADTAVSLSKMFGARIILLDRVSDISSTDIRNRVVSFQPLKDLLPQSVVHQIYYKGLYQTENILFMYNKLRNSISDHRMHHTAGVIETALLLAHRYGIDPGKAFLAALLHDCAKSLSEAQLLELSDDPNPILPVLHAEAGAKIASSEYGIDDPEILQAIRLHTTGDRNMTGLDKIIYVADMIEPSRTYPGVEILRQETDLDQLTLLALRQSISFVQKKKQTVHPATYRAIIDLGGSV